ncbi:outer membrane beta-barrel protein [Oricola sp.]|uniref:outer membrane beta-barrel protein n=1 Tax=Oricola sp. TaxID=1979950 RepID=UPI003BAC09DF
MRRVCMLAIVAAIGGTVSPAHAQLTNTLRGSVEEDILLRNPQATAADEATEEARTGIPAPQYRPITAATDPAEERRAAGESIFELPTPLAVPDPAEEAEITVDVPPEARFSTGRVDATGSIGPLQGGAVSVDDDPFAATGIRLGTFILRPTVELGVIGDFDTDTVDDGTTTSQVNTSSVFAEGVLRLNLASDWNRHSLSVDANGRWQTSLDGDAEAQPRLDIDVAGRFDVSDATTLNASAGYRYFREDPQSSAFFAATDPGLIPAVTGTNEPATQSLNGSLDLRHDFGNLYGEIGGTVTRTVYGDARLSDNTVISQGDLDDVVYDGRLRAGFAASAVYSPFVEAGLGLRRMDVTPDSGGVDRNAARYVLRAGMEFDFGEKLNGEVSAGFLHEDIADNALADISGVAVDAEVNWSPVRETDVRLGLRTSTETSGAVGESGAVLYAADLAVTQRVFANLTAELNGGIDYRDAQGGTDEITARAGAAYTYWFNRFAGVTTRVEYEQTFSSEATDRSRSMSAFAGLRLQR